MAGAAPYPVHAQRAHPGRGLAFPVGNDADGGVVCVALWHGSYVLLFKPLN